MEAVTTTDHDEVVRLAHQLPRPAYADGSPISLQSLLAKSRCLVPGVDAVEMLTRAVAHDRTLSDAERRVVEGDPLAVWTLLRTASSTQPVRSWADALLVAQKEHLLATFQAANGLRHLSLSTSHEADVATHSVATAVCARVLATYDDEGDANAAFVNGMFVGLGRLVMSIVLPHSYGEVLETARLTSTPLAELEEAWLGFSNVSLVSHIAQDAELDDELQVVLEHQDAHDGAAVPAGCAGQVAVVQIAQSFAELILAGDPLPRPRRLRHDPAFRLLPLLGIATKELSGVFDECRWACFDHKLTGAA